MRENAAIETDPPVGDAARLLLDRGPQMQARNVRFVGALLSHTPGDDMSTYIGPNGRLYHRESSRGKWIAFAILCVIMISVAIVGLPSIAAAFRYAGL